jgi:choline dehydrogenase
MSSVTDFDFIIVGAGSAGCLLANRLSANPDHRVLLIEAGGDDDWFWIKVPVGYLYTIADPRTDWCFTTEADPGLAGRSIHYARGRVVGGSSSINAMIHMRGQASDYALWAQATGDERWLWGGAAGPGQTLSIYRELEDYFGGADEWHGSGGEIRVERPRVNWKILNAWQAAAAEVGIAPIEEFNRGDNAGSAYFHVNQRRGRRWSMADAFLHPVTHRPNLTVYTQTRALQLLIDDQVREDQRRGAWTTAQRRAGGLRLLKDGHIVEVRARREVILSAGAIGSPHLMQVSGLGPAGLLAEHHVPVAVDLPGVGENLQDHLQLRTVYRVRGVPTVNTLYRNWISRAGMGLQYLLLRSGPMTMPPSTLGAFAKSDPALPSADLEWHVQPLSLPKFGEPLHPFGAITPSVCNLRPSSRDQPEDLLQLPVDGRRPSRRRARSADDPADHGGARPGPLPPSGAASRPEPDQRRGAAECGRRAEYDDLPSGGHLRDGGLRRPWPAAVFRNGARHRLPGVSRRRPSGGRCFGDAHHHLRQHQRTGDAHRRARRTGDPAMNRPIRTMFDPRMCLKGAQQHAQGDLA